MGGHGGRFAVNPGICARQHRGDSGPSVANLPGAPARTCRYRRSARCNTGPRRGSSSRARNRLPHGCPHRHPGRDPADKQRHRASAYRAAAAGGAKPGASVRCRQELKYGDLATDATRMPVPENVALKRPQDFKLIGTLAKRLDTPAKVNGTAVYGIDVRPPGVKIATLAQSPVFGGRVKSVDDTAAKAVNGVRQIVRLDDAVAVVAPACRRRSQCRPRCVLGALGGIGNVNNAQNRTISTATRPGGLLRLV
jgi:hypothetical protein